jgi:ribosomal protein L23
MGHDGFYKIIRLKTGESIICTLDSNVRSLASETHLSLNSPVQVVPLHETRKGNQVVGESFMLRPWIGLSDSTEFTISVDVVMTIGNVKPEVKEQYDNYIFHVSEARKKIEISNAVQEFLREVTPGEVRIIDIDEDYGEDYAESEEG